MFDGPTTAGIDFDAPLVVLDLADVYSSEALAIFMACATAFMQATLDAHRDSGRSAARKVISVVDEAWRVLSELGLGEWLQSSFKLARQHGQQNVIVMHRFSDLSAAGAAGSREARLAEGLLSDAGTRVIYRQSESEAPTAAEITGLTETEAALLPGLGRGEAIWKVGPRSFFVRHLISPREAQLVDTDAAMALTTAEEHAR
jgi:type IV secretory pathway VirB4 component